MFDKTRYIEYGWTLIYIYVKSVYFNSLHEGGLAKKVFQRHIKSEIVLISGHFYGITF